MAKSSSQIPNVLTIAGSDSGGGAGIQADLKTFSALNTYGLSVITAVTAQNTQGVSGVETISIKMVDKQLVAVFDDIEIAAVKIGMLGNADIIETVAKQIVNYQPCWLVLDPVMVATSGDYLLDIDAIETLKEELLPLADLITPNLQEAEALIGNKIESEAQMVSAAKALANQHGCNVLIKGGHASNTKGESNDLLLFEGEYHWLKGERIDTENTHGTGCTLSSAIAANLALGQSLLKAVQNAKAYIQKTIESADDLNVGHGNGPVNHFFVS